MGTRLGKKQKAPFDKLPSTCSGPELVERQASQRGKSRNAKGQGKKVLRGSVS
jgi:hypothetical protein